MSKSKKLSNSGGPVVNEEMICASLEGVIQSVKFQLNNWGHAEISLKSRPLNQSEVTISTLVEGTGVPAAGNVNCFTVGKSSGE